MERIRSGESKKNKESSKTQSNEISLANNELQSKFYGKARVEPTNIDTDTDYANHELQKAFYENDEQSDFPDTYPFNNIPFLEVGENDDIGR
ncbi:hypothetical protein [Peribacillus sp. SCS-155]|uniref:hypothetical protein n=1 Tax=Peribacillus sedimenti TaxID=3115297 RepID=UPI003906A3CE